MHQNNISCVKYFTVALYCFYWVLGLLVVTGSLWALDDPMFTSILSEFDHFMYMFAFAVLFSGCVIVFSAWFACYGIYRRSQHIISWFIFILVITFILEIALGSWILKNKNQLEDLLRASLKRSIQEKYGQSSSTTVSLDVIQKYLHCCGADGPNDWLASQYNNVGRSNAVNIAFASLNSFFNIPESCCKPDITEIVCEMARRHRIDTPFHVGIFDKGCFIKWTLVMANYSSIFIGIFVIIFSLEIIVLFFSLFFCYKVFGSISKNAGP